MACLILLGGGNSYAQYCPDSYINPSHPPGLEYPTIHALSNHFNSDPKQRSTIALEHQRTKTRTSRYQKPIKQDNFHYRYGLQAYFPGLCCLQGLFHLSSPCARAASTPDTNRVFVSAFAERCRSQSNSSIPGCQRNRYEASRPLSPSLAF